MLAQTETMDLKRLVKAMPWIVGIGLCVVEALKLTVLLDSANSKDAGTGHTEPFLFAPEISRDWSFVTGTQMWVLGTALSVVLLLAALMLVLNVWNRVVEAREAAAEPPDQPAEPAPPRTTPSGRKSFGRAR